MRKCMETKGQDGAKKKRQENYSKLHKRKKGESYKKEDNWREASSGKKERINSARKISWAESNLYYLT